MATENNTGASPEVMRRLRKLLELARQGVGGEKENAERMLTNTMAKYGVTMDMLADEHKSPHRFNILNASEEKLLLQVLGKVLQSSSVSWRKRRRFIVIELTAAQHVEAGMLYDMYRRQWRKEQERLFLAFLHKHQIFAPANPDKPNTTQMTHEEYMRLKRMMSGLDSVQIHKQIGEE